MTAKLAQLVDGVVVHHFDLIQDTTRIGRHPDNDIVIDDAAASSSHALITREVHAQFPGHFDVYIEDCGSTNGTLLNDQPIVGKQRLHHQDVVRIAWNRFKFIDENEAGHDKTAHMIRTQGPED